MTPADSGTLYYISPTGNDSTGNGTSAFPWKTLTKAVSVGSGGDTYIYKDGTYDYPGCEIIDDNLKSGSPGDYTIVKAEHDGGALITQEDGLYFLDDISYIQLEGFKFQSTSTVEKCLGGLPSAHHLKALRCAFVGGPATGNAVNADTGGSYILFEDCWFYGGGGRYQLMVYEADHVILRRCVVRQDGGWTYDGSNPEAGFSVYASSHVYLENCIAIDHDLTYSQGESGAFYNTGHEWQSSLDNHYIGCIALNVGNTVSSYHFDTDGAVDGMSMTDCVAYDGPEGIGGEKTGHDTAFARITIGNMADQAMRNSQEGRTWTLTNSVLWGAGASAGGITASYADSYEPNDFTGTGIIHADPLANGLLYLPRIEAGSVLAAGGSGSTQMGARVLHKVGASGTLWGESGWNTVTSEQLWPWPNEDRIKADMASASARGFCAGVSIDGSPQTLTKYIWEYLGNQMPSNIYED